MTFTRITCFAALLSSHAALAAVLPDSLYSDGMLLQRDQSVPIAGSASPGEALTVRFHGQTKTGTADAKGRWRILLAPMAAGGPFDMQIQGRDSTFTIRNALVGDVWLCSGQSNMQFTVGGMPSFTQDSVNATNLPLIRQWNVQEGRWIQAVPASIRAMTAVGFLTAREVQKSQNVPVGIVLAALGGSVIETWMPPGSGPGAYSMWYNKYIVPLLDFPIRGVLWYQGESNTGGNTAQYPVQFAGLVQGWRAAWKLGDFPFYWVQLPNYLALQTNPNEDSGWAQIRNAQRLSLTLPNTGMAVTIDVGEAGDIHPKDKLTVGLRLSRVVLARSYGAAIEYSGPMYESMKVEGSKLRLHFNHAAGLTTQGGPYKTPGLLKGFVVAGADGKFQFADAVIDGSDVLVSSSQVPAPTQARYAWANNPVCNLYNGAGLPASPFQTAGPQLPVALAKGTLRLAARAPWTRPDFRGRDGLGRRATHRPTGMR